MTASNDCRNRQETIAALVLGELESSAAEEIRKHIYTCEKCRLLYQALTEEEETIRSAFKAVEDKSRAVADNLVAQFDKDSLKSSFGTAILHRLRLVSSTPRRLAELAAAALIIIGVFVGIYHWAGSNVAWADVVEQFRAMPFFSASIYSRDDVTAEPQQIELWMNRQGKTRMRLGTQVIFGRHGQIIESFDIKTRAKVEPDERAAMFLRRIGEADEFSLDSIVRVMFAGQKQDVTPLVNPDAVISEDMVVFDVNLPRTAEWVRIWALRESRLPVRIKVWNPRDGASTDAVFEYSREQADDFFDPNAFEDVLRTGGSSSRVNLAYAFLKDPGGKKITPEEIFAKSGYHMPQVKRLGVTPEGAVWVTAGKGRNRTPNGNVFHGFSRIEDDLGRTYFGVGGGHRLEGDVSFDVFVPIDYPFDGRKPTKITLFCEVEDYNPSTEPELIGTIDLTEWERNAPCPDLFGPNYADTLRLKISLAYKLFASEHAERLDRLARTIPEWTEQPDSKSLLFFRIRLAQKHGNDEEVIRIGEALAPLIFEKPQRESRYGLREYLVALARTGRIDEAAKLFRKIDAIDEMLPEKSDERYYCRFIENTADELMREAELTLEQINKILGFDISKRKEYEHILERAKRAAAERKVRQAAEQRRKEIADYYETHPLPDRMELLKRASDEKIYLMGVPNTVPGHEDFNILPINYKISGLVSSLRYYGEIQPYSLVPLRIEAEAAEEELFADLIYKDGFGPRERAEFVLNWFGMELIVEPGESRKVMVARHDGRLLKSYKQVKAPLPYNAEKESRVGMKKAMTVGGFTMRQLLLGLAMEQNRDIEQDAEKMLIVDETGIEGPVSIEQAFWPGDDGLRFAEKWFEENLGVTFTEETRTMQTYIIRKRQQ